MKRNLLFAMLALSLAFITTCANPFFPEKGDPFPFDYSLGAENIGKTGPGGGKVFFYKEAGFTDTYTGNTLHYLEAAPADMPATYVWASTGYTNINSGTAEGIGTGRRNTALILLATDANAPAALACKNYTGGGKTDWFLPSRDELTELYNNKNVLGILTGTYWSSSDTGIYAWSREFSFGGEFVAAFPGAPKRDTYQVRAVRSF